MAFRTIWCVDIGRCSLKAVQLHRDRNNIEILAVDKVDYSAGPDGFDPDQAREALSIFAARNEIRDPIVVIHPGQGTFMRFIKIPAFDEKKINEMVGYEAQQQIPFPLDEVIWDFHVVDRDYMSGEERDVGMFAVRREAIDDFLEEFSDGGMQVEMLSISYLGMHNFAAFDLDVSEPTIVLDLGASHTDLILLDQDRFWIRQVPHRAEDITRALMQRFKLGFAEAERLKCQLGKNPKQAAKIFQVVIQPKLRELVQEVQRSMGYYRNQAGETKFERCLLFGNGAKLLGIKKYLQDNLGLPVERVASINHLRLSREVNVKLLQSELPSFGVAFGGALQALGVGSSNVDLIPTEEKAKKVVARKRIHAFIAAAILCLCILAAIGIVRQQRASVSGIVEAAQTAREHPDTHKERVEQLQTILSEKLPAEIDELIKVGERRSDTLESFRVLLGIFKDMKNADAPIKVIPEGDEAAVERLVRQAEAGLGDKVWLPYMKMERILKKPEFGAFGGDEDSDKQKGTPAWKFDAFAVIKARANVSLSHDALRDMFSKRLSIALGEARRRDGSQLTFLTNVDLAAGKNLDMIQMQAEGDAGAGTFSPLDGDDEEGKRKTQRGGPYYGAMATWHIMADKPKDPDAGEEDEDDEDFDDDDEDFDEDEDEDTDDE